MLLVSMCGGEKSAEGNVGDGEEEQVASDDALGEFNKEFCRARFTLVC